MRVYVLVTYGKASGMILGVSRRMTLRQAEKLARNTDHFVDIISYA